jgi:hypothetical protein
LVAVPACVNRPYGSRLRSGRNRIAVTCARHAPAINAAETQGNSPFWSEHVKLKLTSKLVLGAVALAAGVSSQAALTSMETDNGSLMFVAIGNGATPASLVVDLGYFLSDFASGNDLRTAVYDSTTGALVSATQFGNPFGASTVQWNFASNTTTVNGVVQAGSSSWSAPLAAFQAAASDAQTQWGVIAGGMTNYPSYFLTTGNPTSGQLGGQFEATSNMGVANTITNFSNVASGAGVTNTLGDGGNGANSAVGSTGTAVGYIGNGGIMGSSVNWAGNLNWSAVSATSVSSPLWQLVGDGASDAVKLTGTLSYANGVLTWAVEQTPVVPEPSGYLLALAGFGVLAFVGRRRLEQ